MKLLTWTGSLLVVGALVAIAVAKPLPKGRWNAVLVKDASWSLPIASEKYDGSADSLTITVTEVRTVGAAQVARLDYELVGGNGDDECALPRQIAVTKKGVYWFDADVTDAAITKAIRKQPMFPAAGSVAKFGSRKDGSYAELPKDHADAACYGWNADPECGAAPCYSWICLDDKGVVAVGDFGMDGGRFGFAFSPSNLY
jgi:hypothetical protein